MTSEDMVALYTQGQSVRDIASQAGVSHVTVWKKLKKSGIPLRDAVVALKKVGARTDVGRLREEAARVLMGLGKFSAEELRSIFRESSEWLRRVQETKDGNLA